MKLDRNHTLPMRVQALVKAQKPGNPAVGGRSARARRRSGLALLATAGAFLSIVLPIGLGASELEAQTLDVLHGFGGPDGANPFAELVEASDGALYGTAQLGGVYGNGIVFKLNKDGSGFLQLHDFEGSDGSRPSARLIVGSDGALYGTTQLGGAYGNGIVFKLNKDGSGFLNLHEFDGSDGAVPQAGVIEASDGALYGTTASGGPYGGVVFRLNKDGSILDESAAYWSCARGMADVRDDSIT